MRVRFLVSMYSAPYSNEPREDEIKLIEDYPEGQPIPRQDDTIVLNGQIRRVSNTRCSDDGVDVILVEK